MPQMAPLWWEILFILFIMSFIFMNTIIYYNKNLKSIKSVQSNKLLNKELNWKW
uniref:ATP synthase F0 subunit 8 n=1 Tax=Melanacanthus marginatus TaxID=2924067 RepID=UPI001FA6D74B|nr:ATP synthase F0 subunit 8 [Melanacanthus marginatus]UMY75925.1 ATP synthase F0 subunit 8 [Melanacanthus marginatus]